MNDDITERTAPYVLKTVPFKFKGADMSFDLSHALFSSFDIDQGSRLLLKLVAKNVDAASVGSVVDIGSGVGVLGVAAARGFPGASVRFRDRDALACDFSRRNARRNKVTPVSVDHALFLDGIEDERFDLVLCNVPAKAGAPVLDAFLRSLPALASERGYAALVVVNPIAEAAEASLRAAGAEFVAMEKGSGHTAIIARRGSAAALAGLPLSLFERSRSTIDAGRRRYPLCGYWGLPEFDTPSFATELAVELCRSAMTGALVRRAAFVNPGIGRVACHVAASCRDLAVDLASRDRLALEAAAANVALGPSGAVRGMSAASTAELPDAAYDFLVELPDLTPRVDTAGRSWDEALRLLKRGAAFVVSMPSAAMDRFERARPKGFTRIAERKKKGFAAAAWRLD